MPGYVPIHPVLGSGPVNELWTPSATARWPVGMVLDAHDPYFGYGRFVYCKAGAADMPGRLVTLTTEAFVTADVADTANLGYPFLVARQIMTQDYYGWYQIEGMCPVQTGASVAAGVVAGIGGAGVAGAVSNGKQLLGVKVLRASTFTLTKTGTTTKGSPIIQVSNVDGLFYGLVPSGTGIAAGTITAIDPSGRAFTDSANATASGTVTVTFTYTGFLLVHINAPRLQGQTA